MQTKKILLTMLAVVLSHCHTNALTNQPTNEIVLFNGYSAVREANGNYRLINPAEFWRGTWKENTNGWRVQLKIYTNTTQDTFLSVEWGSVFTNSGGGYLVTPNGKFAKFELLDPHGNMVQPKPSAGANLLRGVIADQLVYGTNLPAWAAPSAGTLEAKFPGTSMTNVYPRRVIYSSPRIIPTNVYPYACEISTMSSTKLGDMVGDILCISNEPPSLINYLNLSDLYSIKEEGDYTFVIQPVLYKKRRTPEHSFSGILDRVDLPCVTTKVHLVPRKEKENKP